MSHPSHFLAIHSHAEADDRTILSLTGDVDLRTGPRLREEILKAAAGPSTVVIDLENVQFMDSPGLGMLIHCHRQLVGQHVTMVVRSPHGDVRALFDMVDLASVLNVVL